MMWKKLLALGVAASLSVLGGCDDDDDVLPMADAGMDAPVTGPARDGATTGDVAKSDAGGGDAGGGDAGGDIPASKAYGLTTDGKLITFDVTPPPGASPIIVKTPTAITGLAATEVLYSITVRPKDGRLYGLGSTSRIYLINPDTAVATVVGTAPLSPALNGTTFGFDFNPTVDKIRVVSETESNFRADPDTGAVLPAPAAPGVPDVALTPAGNVVAVAYTNSFAGSTKTTLYGIDTTTPAAPKLIRIGGVETAPSPNAGNVVDVGPLGVASSNNTGIDIHKSMTFAYAVLEASPGKSSLYTVNLTSGAATKVGDIGATAVALRSFALAQ